MKYRLMIEDDGSISLFDAKGKMILMGCVASTDTQDATLIYDFDTVIENNMAEHTLGTPILQDWALRLGLKHQGVLLGAVRGCDSLPKNHISKHLVRALRAEFLIPFIKQPKSFIVPLTEIVLSSRMSQFLDNGLDNYPWHWMQHFMQAVQVVGYKRNVQWLGFYYQIVKAMHLEPEYESVMDARLNKEEAE